MTFALTFIGTFFAIIILSCTVLFLLLWATTSSPKNNSTIYKDFYVDDLHTFTIHLDKEGEDIRVSIYKKHLPPTNRFEKLKEDFAFEEYDHKYLRSYDNTPLKYFIYEMIQDILKKEKSIIEREKDYQDFINSSDDIFFKKNA